MKLKTKNITQISILVVLFLVSIAFVLTSNSINNKFANLNANEKTIATSSLIIPTKYSSIESQATSPKYYANTTQHKGVKVIAEGDGAEVKFNKIIDLNYNDKTNPLVTFMVTPNINDVIQLATPVGGNNIEYGMPYEKVTVTLTDVYDVNNRVNIELYKGSWSHQYSFVKAGSNFQLLTGLDKNVAKTEYRMGRGATHSFTANNLNANNTISFSIDYKERQIFVSPAADVDQYSDLVIDLDDPNHFGETTLWNGFTTGEAYLSITLASKVKDKAELLLLDVNGISLGEEKVTDTDAPIIKVDTKNYTLANLPIAKKGLPYPLFDLSVYDRFEGKMNADIITTEVKFGAVGSEKTIAVTNGKFTPTESGKYTVKLSAKDGCNNIGYTEYFVTAENALDPLTASFNSPLPESITVGAKTKLPLFTVKGGSGEKAVELIVLDKDNKEIILDKNIFVPLKSGTYTVNINIVDFLGQKATITETIDAIPTLTPIVEIPYILPIIVNNTKYYFPDFTATDYVTTEGKPQMADKKITVNGATLNSDREYTPNITTESEILKVVYSAYNIGNKAETKKEFDVKVVKVLNGKNKIDFTKYFDGEVTKVQEANSIKFTADKDLSVSFINPLLADGFDIKFDVKNGENNFNAVAINIYDSLNIKQKLTLRIDKGLSTDKFSYLTVNGGTRKQISGTFYDNVTDRFNLGYSSAIYGIIDKNSDKIIEQVTHYSDGSEFIGFSSQKVICDIEFIGVTGKSSLDLYELCGQSMTNTGMDWIGGRIKVSESIFLKATLGETFIVPSAITCDVLDAGATITSKVTYNKEIVLEESSANTERNFIIDKFGSYKITYQSVDKAGNPESLQYIIYVNDNVCPKIVINGEVKSEAEKGEKYILPTATATDNATTFDKVSIAVTNPYGVMLNVINNEVTFDLKGKYVITYYVFDDCMNYDMKEFIVNVA